MTPGFILCRATTYVTWFTTCLDLGTPTPTSPVRVYYWIRGPICPLHSGNYSTLIHQIFSRDFYLRILTVKTLKECTSIPLPVAHDPLLRLIIITESTYLQISWLNFYQWLKSKINPPPENRAKLFLTSEMHKLKWCKQYLLTYHRWKSSQPRAQSHPQVGLVSSIFWLI